MTKHLVSTLSKLVLLLSILGFVFLPVSATVHAQGFFESLGDAAYQATDQARNKSELDSNPFNANLVVDTSSASPQLQLVDNPAQIAVQIIRALLTFMGVGTIALMIYAGARWMTAAGNDQAVADAKKTLRNAVIGLILITMSYSITIFVTRRLQKETGSYGVGGSRIGGQVGLDGISGSVVDPRGGNLEGAIGPGFD